MTGTDPNFTVITYLSHIFALYLIGTDPNFTVITYLSHISALCVTGTEPNLRDTGNAKLATPVRLCAAEMICAIQARWDETVS